jgi:tripartite-type tricarboxylate transporter receptor subunit TctC
VLFSATGALAQERYPERMITIIVPFSPGGSTDILSRLAAKHISEKLGQPVIVENRAGGGSNIGIAAAARAKPDGYTFLSAPDSILINQSLYRNAPFDIQRDFVPVSDFISSPNVIFVAKDSEIKMLAQLVDMGKKNPSMVNYATPGVGTPPNLAMEMLNKTVGTNVVHVPYSGAAPVIQAVLSGTVQVGVMALSAAHAQIKAGTLRAIAIMGDKRWPDLPDVPTVKEEGFDFPSASVSNAQAMFAPAQTPQNAVDTIAKLVIEIMQDPKTRQTWENNGSLVTAQGPAALGERIRRESVMWKDIVDSLGVAK